MLRSLSDIVAPIPLEDFLRALQSKQRLHIRAADPARAESLLPWQEIETLISMGNLDNIEVMQNGMLIPPQLYQSEAALGTFHDILLRGASVILRQVQGTLPQMQWLATSIERQMSFPVGINAYLSFVKGGAFKPHWDRHDVLVVQVHGTKAWKIWDATFTNPIERSRDAKHDITGAPSQELELGPGDVLYIPRGEPHAASLSGGASVHLSIGLDSLNGVDVLHHLTRAAGLDDFLRADLPPRAPAVSFRAYEAELKARLHHLVDGLDIAALLDEDNGNRPPLRHVSLASSEGPGDILRLTLRRRVPLPAPGEAHPVRIGGAEHALSPAAIDVLRQLFVSDCQPRGALVEALSSRHDRAAVTAGVGELMRLGFLMTDRAV